MPQTNHLDVTIIPTHGGADLEDPVFKDVQYISFVSSPGGTGEGTYGIPALLSDEKVKRDGLPFKVLYVNPACITAMEVVRCG